MEEEAVEDVADVVQEIARSAPEPADKVSELLEVATELVNAAADNRAEAPPAVQEVPEPQPVEESFEPGPQPIAQEPEAEFAPPPAKAGKPGFSTKFLEGLAAVGGFYGKSIEVEPDLPEIPVVPEEFAEPEAAPEVEATDEPAPDRQAEPEPELQVEVTPNPTTSAEGTLQSKLTEVRAKADEARQAKLRANVALYEGLSAAYDFALDAEDKPEEYLKLVEEQGLKIQLRSPMKPVVKLAFNGM